MKEQTKKQSPGRRKDEGITMQRTKNPLNAHIKKKSGFNEARSQISLYNKVVQSDTIKGNS